MRQARASRQEAATAHRGGTVGDCSLRLTSGGYRRGGCGADRRRGGGDVEVAGAGRHQGGTQSRQLPREVCWKPAARRRWERVQPRGRAEGRLRGGCWSHLRTYFFDARHHHPAPLAPYGRRGGGGSSTRTRARRPRQRGPGGVPRFFRAPRRMPTRADIDAVLRVTDTDDRARDHVLVAVAAGTGLRVHELVALVRGMGETGGGPLLARPRRGRRRASCVFAGRGAKKPLGYLRRGRGRGLRGRIEDALKMGG